MKSICHLWQTANEAHVLKPKDEACSVPQDQGMAAKQGKVIDWGCVTWFDNLCDLKGVVRPSGPNWHKMCHRSMFNIQGIAV